MYEEDSDESWGGDSDEDNDDYAPVNLAPPREDLEQIMDDFLSRFEVLGGKMKPVLDSAPGIEGNTGKLERIRRELDNIRLDDATEGEDPALTAQRQEKERILAAVERQWREEVGKKGKVKMSYEKPKERWDCETVLSESLITPHVRSFSSVKLNCDDIAIALQAHTAMSRIIHACCGSETVDHDPPRSRLTKRQDFLLLTERSKVARRLLSRVTRIWRKT